MFQSKVVQKSRQFCSSAFYKLFQDDDFGLMRISNEAHLETEASSNTETIAVWVNGGNVECGGSERAFSSC